MSTRPFCVGLRASASACVCVCVVSGGHCMRGAPFDHISAYKRHCMLYTFCFLNAQHTQQYSMLSKSAESFSAWIVAFQFLALLQF